MGISRTVSRAHRKKESPMDVEFADRQRELERQFNSVDKEARRHSVDFLYHLLNWDFIKDMARIAAYAHAKYGSVQQYTDSRLSGDKSPVNHMIEHIRMYQCEEKHDHFGTVEMQLAAVAYNAMMEYYYYKVYGPEEYKLHVVEKESK